MIVEERIYTMYVGKLDAFLELYEQEGLPILQKHLGKHNPFGAYLSEVGPQNMYVHLWVFEDFADRTKRRAALAADPSWAPYKAKNQPRILSQESRIMRPAPFIVPTLKLIIEAGMAR